MSVIKVDMSSVKNICMSISHLLVLYLLVKILNSVKVYTYYYEYCSRLAKSSTTINTVIRVYLL